MVAIQSQGNGSRQDFFLDSDGVVLVAVGGLKVLGKVPLKTECKENNLPRVQGKKAL